MLVFFLFREGKQWAYFLGTLLPLSPGQVARLYRNISDTIIANVYGILSVGVAQGILVGSRHAHCRHGILAVAGLGRRLCFHHPRRGLGTDLGAGSIYLLAIGSMGKGLFLLLYSIVIVSSVDNVLRPWVVGGRVELHPLVLLFFIFGGVEAFGFLGLFLGPVVASVLTAVFDMLREEVDEPKPPSLPIESEVRQP